ncbi:type II secretion system protein N [Parvularcula maris]|uniref:Type II secretion system protein GspC N-terminal domain-containing protein n=1 Tax=Parvularcula maris TaxID=2965077 RepID=A0A9X2L8R1_9PROT|nr:type II secretion system protein N [Parvularcula maris]MCQ8185053.1 hypothetical protein [Parvularcula maris]
MTGRDDRQAKKRGMAPLIAAACAVVLLALAAADVVLAVISPVTAEAPSRTARAEGRQMEVDLSVLSRVNPFEGAPEVSEGPVTASLPVTTLQLKLKSAYRVSEGVSSALIETPNGRQQRFREGDQIIRGVELDEVRGRAVVISRSGRREILPLESFPIAPEEMQIGGEAAPIGGTIEVPAEEEVQRVAEAAASGENLQTLAGPLFPLLAQQGAEPGDVPVALNGRPIEDGEGWDTIAAAAQREGRVTLTVLRGGERRDIVITVPSGITL